jgi:glutamate dehydrogenase (NAD(P)+)
LTNDLSIQVAPVLIMQVSQIPKSLKSQQIHTNPEQGRFASPSELVQEGCYQIIDPETLEVWGFVAIDNIKRGSGLGGIRMAQNVSMNEVSRLARVMTLKNSAACLPYGGAKAGLVIKNPDHLFNSSLRKLFLDKYADALFDLESYIPAPDMGTDEWDIQTISENHSNKLGKEVHNQGGAGRPESRGGIPIDEWELTAHGLFSAIKTMESVDETLNLPTSNYIVQGFGNVGAPTALKLQKEGATLVGASDINIAIWNPKGLDVHLLNKIRKEPGGLCNYSLEVKKTFSSKNLDWLLEAPCDILIPCARPDAITAKNVDRIQCRYILQGANTPSSKPVEYYLHHCRNIISLTDFIVNAGGVIGCAVERKISIDGSYATNVKTVGIRNYVENLIGNTIKKNVLEIQTQIKGRNGYIFRDAATELAMGRLLTKETWL